MIIFYQADNDTLFKLAGGALALMQEHSHGKKAQHV
jgi:hypothetical protein